MTALHLIQRWSFIEREHLLEGGAYLFHDGVRYHLETCPLICGAN